MTQQSSPPKVGYLRSCMDRRFLAATRRAFEQATSLGEAEYYHEAYAGGALNNPAGYVNFPTNSPPVPNGADYVYGLNGKDITLAFMGWQVHIDHCGGLPELHNDEIVTAFRKLIADKYFQNTYPNVQHLFLVQPAKTLTLTFSNLGDYIAWCNVSYTDLRGNPQLWRSPQIARGTNVSTEVPAQSQGITVTGGSIGDQGQTGQPMQITNATTPDTFLGGTKTYYLTGTFSNPIGSDTAPTGSV